MMPEARDKLRWCSDAAIFAAESVGEGDAERLDIDRAIIAYCPPGAIAPPSGMTLDANDRGVSISGGSDQEAHGWLYLASLADAERLAWALLAEVARVRSLTTKPADAGEETP